MLVTMSVLIQAQLQELQEGHPQELPILALFQRLDAFFFSQKKGRQKPSEEGTIMLGSPINLSIAQPRFSPYGQSQPP